MGSSNNRILFNILINNGLVAQNSYQNIVKDNFVNNKTLVYLENASGVAVESAGKVILVNCYNVSMIITYPKQICPYNYGTQTTQKSLTTVSKIASWGFAFGTLTTTAYLKTM